MSTWLLVAISIGYFGTAVSLLYKGQIAPSVMFASYGVANIALIYMT